ncbi:hypothetical protein SUNI508_05739 [Seiridium unicorne]|uniref:Uncharacterized protein n=1 Tax=Seiridium unicorne TaxID=138068 RepID=A0ABR2V3L3_9PEZI
MGSKIFSDVLNIIMPLDKPLDALVITVMPIEEWHQHPTTSWLTFRCAHSGKSWLWNVRDLDDDIMTHSLQVPRIGELIVHVIPADPFEKCQIVKLWTKVRDVSWILPNFRKISKLDIQFHAEFLKGEGERAFLWSSTFTLSIAGAGLQSSYNFCSLVAMALVLPLLERRAFETLQVDIPYSRTISFKGKHDIFTTFHTPLPPDSESEIKGIPSSKNNLYTPSEIKAMIGEIDHMNQYMDVAVDEVQGFEGDMLRLRRMRLYMTSARNCLSAQSRQQFDQHALVLRDTELEMLLSPSAGLTDAFKQAAQTLPKLSLDYTRTDCTEIPGLQPRWGRDEWTERYPRGLPPFKSLSSALCITPLDGTSLQCRDNTIDTGILDAEGGGSPRSSASLLPPICQQTPKKQVHWPTSDHPHETDQDDDLTSSPDDLQMFTGDCSDEENRPLGGDVF